MSGKKNTSALSVTMGADGKPLTKSSSKTVNTNQLGDPGIGAPVEGAELRRVTAAILNRLDFELDETPYKTRPDRELTMP